GGSPAWDSSTYWDSTSTAVPGSSWRTASAARSPSSVNDGGIRTSTTATSGRWCRTASRSASPSPTAATTVQPASSSSRTRPSRSSTESSASTTRIQRMLRDGGGDDGPAALRAVHLEGPVDAGEPGAQPGQPVPLADVGAPHAVVAHHHPQHAVVGDPHDDPGGPGVLGRVGEGLGDDEVRRGLPCRGEPGAGRQGDVGLHGDRALARDGDDGGAQPAVDEHRRGDAAGQGAQLGEPELDVLQAL